MPSTYKQIRHHGHLVWTKTAYEGINGRACLCYGCALFKPNERENNCSIAEEVYKRCVLHGLTTPVTECPKFEAVDPDACKEEEEEEEEAPAAEPYSEPPGTAAEPIDALEFFSTLLADLAERGQFRRQGL